MKKESNKNVITNRVLFLILFIFFKEKRKKKTTLNPITAFEAQNIRPVIKTAIQIT